MTIYIDFVAIINLVFDFCILLTVDMLLKRNTKLYKIFLGALIGEASLILFIINNYFLLFSLKLIISIIMIITSFSYKNIKYTLYNIIYFYLVSIILGGFIYFILNEFRININYSIRYIIVLMLCPIILFFYSKLNQKQKIKYNNKYIVEIKYNNYILKNIGYLDTGNTLTSNNKPVIIVEKSYIKLNKLKLLPITYKALNHTGIIYCFKPDYVKIENKIFKNILVGLSDDQINLDGNIILLNSKMEI